LIIQDQPGFAENPDGSGGWPSPKYFIDAGRAEERHRSLSMMIAGRRCYMCQQGGEELVAASDLQEQIDRIVDHCAATSDYLLPDTPLKEAIFRIILSGGNEPMAAEAICAILANRWGDMVALQRNTSPSVIGRLLEHSENYCIARAPEAEGDE
jgi:hypothetical protein